MKEAIKYVLAMAVSAIAMFAYMYEAPPEGVGLEVTQEASSQHHPSALPRSSNKTADQTKRELTAAELADIDPASIDWEAIRERYRDITSGSDAMLSPGSVFITDFSPEEIAAYNKLHVVPFNPTVGEECGPMRIELDDGAVEDSYNCVPVYERPEHPYRNLSYEELTELVELNNDAEAAMFAARYAAPSGQAALALSIHAAALSGKSGPILKASRYLRPSQTRDASLDELIADYAKGLVLENVAALMGDPRAKTENAYAKSYLVERGLDPSEMEGLEAQIKDSASELLKQMGEMQRDLTGATGILELTDA